MEWKCHYIAFSGTARIQAEVQRHNIQVNQAPTLVGVVCCDFSGTAANGMVRVV